MLGVPSENGARAAGRADPGGGPAGLAETSGAGGPALGDRPVAKLEERAGLLVYRDDLFEFNGVFGGKVRSCLAAAERALHKDGAEGLVTACGRSSAQGIIVAAIGEALGAPVRVHVPAGEETPELWAMRSYGATLIPHRPGYNNVVTARARAEAHDLAWANMVYSDLPEAVEQNAGQFLSMMLELLPLVAGRPDLQAQKARLIVPVGAGMTMAGLLWGREGTELRRSLEVTGVYVGEDPSRNLSRWAPGWDHPNTGVSLVKSARPYRERLELELDGLRLEPTYEAKAAELALPGDMLWLIAGPQPRAEEAPR